MRDDCSDPRTGEAIAAPGPAVGPGDRLKDRYDVVAHIGSGGMADVFSGIDALFQRDVAIKVLKPERVDEVMKRRVLREARATCAVDHPHMLRITDMGLAGEAPFLVADLLVGHTLAEALRRAPGGRLDWRRAVRLLLPAMAALHMAHDAGLVHRDIKPENLFLHHRRGEELLIVLDLGIVKYVNLDGTRARWTRSGMILGTALYMPPEQVHAQLVDRRSDVYAMGATLYRLLSGQHLFPTPTGDGPIAAMTKHLFEPPPRLTGRRLPRALVEAVYTAVAKEPGQRHATMAEFAARLDACLADDEARTASGRRALHGVSLFGLGAGVMLLGAGVVREFVAQEAPLVAPADPCDPCHPCDPCPDVSPVASSEPKDVSSGSSSTPVVEDDAPAPAAPSQEPPTRRRSKSRGLARATGAVQQCLRVHGDVDMRSVTVQAALDARGRVASTAVIGAFPSSPLGTCVRAGLAALRFEPGPPRTLEHTYHAATDKETP